MINIEIVDNRHVADLVRLEDNIRSLYGLDNVQVMDCATSERGLIMHRIAKMQQNMWTAFLKMI